MPSATLAQNHLSRCATARARGGGELWTPVPTTSRRLSASAHAKGHLTQPPRPTQLPPEPGIVTGLLSGRAVPTGSMRSSCGSPDCSAFSHVSLVLSLSHADRVPLLLSYAPWFASLLFLVSDAGAAPCAQCRAAVRANATALARGDRAACHCVDEWVAAGSVEECSPLNISWSAVRHRHYPALFEHALALAAEEHGREHGRAAGGRQSRGVLLAHADMFLNVRRFHGAAFDAPWMARGGLPLMGNQALQRMLPVPRCYAVTSRTFAQDRSWFWFDHAKPRCREAVQRLGGAECCFGWADILYLPRALLAPFGRALGSFAAVHHEVAVATVLRLLATREPRAAVRALHCHGSCCTSLERRTRRSPRGFQPDPRTSDALCGHRLKLNDARHQRLIRSFLEPMVGGGSKGV